MGTVTQDLLFGEQPAETETTRWETQGGAHLSACGTYRYLLTRRWHPDGLRRVVWIMCNPSTADATQDDPTIRRCIGFSKAWGYDALSVVNVSAYRSTDPKALPVDPGPDNDRWLRQITRVAHSTGGVVVAAWGAIAPQHLVERAWMVVDRPVLCLGATKGGSPKHPLYVPASTELREWTP